MPTYAQTTYRSGFYNAKLQNGQYDRLYNAVDMREPYKNLFADGVKPNDDGTLGDGLQVTSVYGMTIRVNGGRGMFGGKFFVNESAFDIVLDDATDTTRYDWVVIRADDSEFVRNTTIYIKSMAREPQESDLVRTSEVNEYILAVVKVEALATSITQSKIYDYRATEYCGLLTGAFNQFDSAALYAQFDAAFHEWFDDVKDQFVAGATLIHAYDNTYYSETVNQQIIPIGIPQYTKNTDTLMVVISGRVMTEGANYAISGDSTAITLTLGLPVVGTKVHFEVFKSVDGSQAESIVAEVGTLQNQMNAVNRVIEYHYYCNGENDNISISNMALDYLSGGTDYGSMRLVIHGYCGIAAPYSTESDGTRIWFKTGDDSAHQRRVILDFSDCRQVNVPCVAGKQNIIFDGIQNNVTGAHIVANGGGSTCMFAQTDNAVINCDNCRFIINAVTGAYIARTGNFTECFGYALVSDGSATCFFCGNQSILKLYGGEYYAYSNSVNTSAVIENLSGYVNAIIITNGISCPTVARSGYVQSSAVVAEAGNCSFSNTITLLNVDADGQHIVNTIEASKPYMLPIFMS